MRASFLLLALSTVAAAPVVAQTASETREAAGIDTAPSGTAPSAPTAPMRGGDAVLMIPQSSSLNVLVLDATTGDLLSAAFLTDDTSLTTPINAIPDIDGSGILVCDQTADAVYRYSAAGVAEGLFAPAGGVDNAVLDNVRGCAVTGDTLLVTSAGPATNTVQAFDASGVPRSGFIAPGAGGLGGPFDVLVRDADVLVSSIGSDNVLRYSRAGAFLDVFASGIGFPEQIHETASGSVLVADFSSSQSVFEFAADGTPIGSYTFGTLFGFRGVYELPGGSLLVTTGSGVYEVLRTGAVVRQIVSGVSGRFIERIPGGFIVAGTEAPSAETVLRVAGANPFASETTLQLTVDQMQTVRVVVFDVTGRLVATLYDGTLAAGTAHVLTLRGAALAPGVYVVRATGETFVATQRVSHAR